MIDKNPTINERQFLRDIHSIAESLKIIANIMAADHVDKTGFEEIEGDDRK